jgi:hypothetical protein
VAQISTIGLGLDGPDIAELEEEPPELKDNTIYFLSYLRLYIDVASVEAAKRLPLLPRAEYTIKLLPGKHPPYKPIYAFNKD